MGWIVKFAKTAEKGIEKLDSPVRIRILRFLRTNVADSSDPRLHGKALSGKMAGLWSYRVGDYRIICDIQDNIVTVLVLNIGHRKDVYR